MGELESGETLEQWTRCAMLSIVNWPTRGTSKLDKVCVNNPCYTTVRVVDSTVKSDHKAVVAYQGHAHVLPLNKQRNRCLFRQRSPAQHVRFLEHASTVNIELDDSDAVQSNFDYLYGVMLDLLNRFYPEREITVTSSDPPYVTPAVKALLRRKNRLMHTGRSEEACAVASHIRTIITRISSRWL